MTRHYFGTDGIRGTANTGPMTADIALRVGMAAGLAFRRGTHRHRAVIAKDTRLSGYLLEPALTAGFISVGVDVVLVGPLPTPAVAMLTRSLRADLGVMISASHNPYQDNGIKLFGPDGYKLSDSIERDIETRMDTLSQQDRAAPDALGRARRLDDAQGRYIEYVKQSFPRHLRLDGLKIVLDCAHGAAYHVGPIILSELGAEVVPLAVSPNGFNINENCGSTSPQALQEAVVREKAHLGIALDGDADRLALADERGALVNGDQLLAMIARYGLREGWLKGGGVVATDMSNLGLERYLETLGLHLKRTAVGDRYVVESMRHGGYNLGGEQSGHIILGDYSTTGDGLIAALQALAVLVEENKPLSALGACFSPFPQKLKSLQVPGHREIVQHVSVKQALAEAEASLKGKGRVSLRPSGTEPLVRIMVESENEADVERCIAALERAVLSATVTSV